MVFTQEIEVIVPGGLTGTFTVLTGESSPTLQGLTSEAKVIELIVGESHVLIKPNGRGGKTTTPKQVINALAIYVPKPCCANTLAYDEKARSYSCALCLQETDYIMGVDALVEGFVIGQSSLDHGILQKVWLPLDIFIDRVSPWLSDDELANIVNAESIYRFLRSHFCVLYEESMGI